MGATGQQELGMRERATECNEIRNQPARIGFFGSGLPPLPKRSAERRLGFPVSLDKLFSTSVPWPVSEIFGRTDQFTQRLKFRRALLHGMRFGARGPKIARTYLKIA